MTDDKKELPVITLRPKTLKATEPHLTSQQARAMNDAKRQRSGWPEADAWMQGQIIDLRDNYGCEKFRECVAELRRRLDEAAAALWYLRGKAVANPLADRPEQALEKWFRRVSKTVK